MAEIFSAAVHEIACEVYTKAQCDVWASGEVNYDHWKRRCELKRPFVSENESGWIEGFLELDPDGHIDCAYVNPAFKRTGVMTRLTEHAIQTCFDFKVDRVYVEASICAKPMFGKLGFQVIAENMVRIGGEDLLNFRMELRKKNAEHFGAGNA
ncbi:MAG: GNAT family N-acetyltransferase [Kiritimatiellae bacterium]|nr:GNAT family N-acetyltransferase [Kiritimatiellia bacterium]